MADVPNEPELTPPDDVAPEKADADAGVSAAATSGEGQAAASGDVELDEITEAEKAVEGDIQELLAEREQFLTAYQRVQADFENYRKQSQKRLDHATASQLGGFVERLLPVLDACDAAAEQGQSEAVEPIMTALYGALQKEGLERIYPKGESFDPEVAEAAIHFPGEGGDQVVAEVIRTGYRWKGRLLRPALVKVTD